MIKKIVQFFVDCKGELKKVAWPSKEELKTSVWVVVISLGLFALFVFIIDWILQNTLGRMV